MVLPHCPACDSVNIQSSGLSGEAVCEDCGTLVDDTAALLVHRQLDEDDTTFHIGIQKVGKDGRTAIANAPRGKGVQRTQINKERRDKDAKVLLSSLGRYFQAANVVDRAMHLYVVAAQDRPTSERQTTILATAAFALALKERKRAESLRQICDFVDLKMLPVTRMYIKLQKMAAVQFSETDPSVFLEGHLLHLSAVCADKSKAITLSGWAKHGRGKAPGTLLWLQETDLRQVRETAMALAEWVHAIDLFVGRHAVSVSIGIVLMALEGTRQTKMPKVVDVSDELAKISGVGSWTCMERYREVAKAVLDWAEHLPGVEIASRHYRVDPRTGWKARAVSKRKEVATLVQDVLAGQANIRAQRIELGLEVGGGFGVGAADGRPQLTLAEFIKLEATEADAVGPRDIGAWGAQAASGKEAQAIPNWDELAEEDDGDTTVVAARPSPAVADLSQTALPAPALPASAYPHALPSMFHADERFEVGLSPPPSRPAHAAPFEASSYVSSVLSALLPAPVDLILDDGPFAGFSSAADHGVSDSMIDPALLEENVDVQHPAASSCNTAPDALAIQAPLLAQSPGSSSGQSRVGSTERAASDAGAEDLPLIVPPTQVSAAPSEYTLDTSAVRVAPSYTPKAVHAKHFRPSAYMRVRPSDAVRQRSLWLKPDAIAAVRESHNDTTILGQLLCAGYDADNLPPHIAPTSTLGAVAALREGGSYAIEDDELFNDGELDAYVRNDDERDFLLELWEKEGLVAEMAEAEAKSLRLEAAKKGKDARRKERQLHQGGSQAKSQAKYAGSRRTKAQRNLDVDAIALMLGGRGDEYSADEDDKDDSCNGGLGALAIQYGAEADDETDAGLSTARSLLPVAASLGPEPPDDDVMSHVSEIDREAAPPSSSTAHGKKRAREPEVEPEQAEWQAIFKRARGLYDSGVGADDEKEDDDDDDDDTVSNQAV